MITRHLNYFLFLLCLKGFGQDSITQNSVIQVPVQKKQEVPIRVHHTDEVYDTAGRVIIIENSTNIQMTIDELKYGFRLKSTTNCEVISFDIYFADLTRTICTMFPKSDRIRFPKKTYQSLVNSTFNAIYLSQIKVKCANGSKKDFRTIEIDIQ